VDVAEGDAVQLNCSVTSSAAVTFPVGLVTDTSVTSLNLSDVIFRHASTGARLDGHVELTGDGVVQFTFDARLSDYGNVYCSLTDGNTTVKSPLTFIYVLSQYCKDSRRLAIRCMNGKHNRGFGIFIRP